MLETATFNTQRMNEQASSPYMATTDLAELMVQNGIPFREAHSIVAGLVQESLENDKDFKDLVKSHPLLGSEGANLLQLDSIASNKKTHGAGGASQLEQQIKNFKESIAKNKEKL